MQSFSPREIVSELDRFIIGQDDAKKVIDGKVNANLKNIVSLFDTNVTAESIKNNITNADLDEYLKNKPVIKG